MSEPPKLVPGKPDAEVAEEIKKQVMEVLAPVMQTIEEAEKAGFHINFNLAKGPLGKQIISLLQVSKVF